ncbi:MAG: hypothetical protein GXP25_07400 [Planctomycetes bacterium]|nr:hypothetical protein [Planctomycetota bacterium]
MDAPGAERIPDPAAGDRTRRFSQAHLFASREAVNRIRPRLWRRRLSRTERKRAMLDAGGVVAWG